eukprot:COSAG02_NODE_198_length_29564_cov_12.279009_2_plen_93_part_00
MQFQWSGALANSGAVAALLNLETMPKQLTLQNEELPPSRISHTKLQRGQQGSWTITEAFSGKLLCDGCSLPKTVEVAPHDVALLILTPTGIA